MLLERRTVSRKTPTDGKLEISRATADTVASFGDGLTVAWSGEVAPGSIVGMRCSCSKGSGGQHEHHFLQSDLLKTLDAGAEVDLELDEKTARLWVTPAR
jgi:hypothetical protein